MHILVSSVITAEQVTDLAKRFPEQRFLHMPDNDTHPEGVEQTEVFLRCAIPIPQQERLIDLAPGLKWIHTCSAGFDYLPVDLIFERQIALTRSAQTNNVPIAEYALAHILAFSKRLPSFAAAQRERSWSRHRNLDELSGRTVGIIGTGSIGTALATRCRALGMYVIGSKRQPEDLPEFHEVLPSSALSDILARADFVVLACPLTSETRGLIGQAELKQMKSSAYLINVARGPIIVTQDLIDALENDHIAGAALDVYDQEPLPEDSPLWTTRNLVLTPHISFSSPHTITRVLEEFANNLTRYLDGQPLLNLMRSRSLGY